MEAQESLGSRVDPVEFVKKMWHSTSSDLFKALSNMYEKPSAMNKVYLMRRLFNL